MLETLFSTTPIFFPARCKEDAQRKEGKKKKKEPLDPIMFHVSQAWFGNDASSANNGKKTHSSHGSHRPTQMFRDRRARARERDGANKSCTAFHPLPRQPVTPHTLNRSLLCPTSHAARRRRRTHGAGTPNAHVCTCHRRRAAVARRGPDSATLRYAEDAGGNNPLPSVVIGRKYWPAAACPIGGRVRSLLRDWLDAAASSLQRSRQRGQNWRKLDKRGVASHRD
ncbi:hypothetical protein B0J12DRAFT_435367 [Macrophomina phaseolina]|uniref:Uncharacterized protein n=1 Tax=Macrophomina phaseolina TaxID=35725 RepID=A0ABQ8GHD6_9PEZI|nr:hypothetical protein B0J12DRAFT_435367 [Macrophomina phaseolina]